MRFTALIFAALGAVSSPLHAGDRQTLASGWISSNDSLVAQSLDRWRSSGEQVWSLTGRGATLPSQPLEWIEWRSRADIFTPENLTAPKPSDRRHAGALSFGAHTHWHRGPVEYSLGAEAVAIGPQTGLLAFQRVLHEVLGFPIPDLEDFQIGNRWRPRLTGEAGRVVTLGPLTLRPFGEVVAGDETILRLGFDVSTAHQGAALRAASTGVRVPVLAEGWQFSAGGDVARVVSSVYLDDPEGWRARMRVGAGWTKGRASLFYGLTWASEEFAAQREPQLIGTLSGQWRF